ncbi:glycosyltransferase family 4 protein [Anditalea andensis]|uniref:Glycosyl transferase n=1 Tax=Anditalea andensis TaxID=1048983 RepID=A0A074LDF5_9BACT|nr:MraY family glycosyltransferase [Anditalea andensis]KEO71822.1 glycosyl transferase [Anditalea andensis]
MTAFLAALTAFFFGFLVTPMVIFFFKRTNILEAPGGRKIHKGMVPSMGGIAILFAAYIGLAAWLSLDQLAFARYLLIALTLMFTLGLRDDLVELTAVQKLLGQGVAAFLVVGMADIRISSFYGCFGIYELPLLVSYGLSAVTIIVLTNSFNLIDGLDGLAGTISSIILGFLGWWLMDAGLYPYAIIAITMVGAILSFLVYNWHPAKIFMGDTGSLSIGFLIAVLLLLFIDRNGTMLAMQGFKFNAPIATGVALMIIPIYDTARIFVKRIRNGRSPLAPDKSHVHHFLLRMGFDHDKVVFILLAVQLTFISFVFLGRSMNDHVMLPLVVMLAVGLGILLDRYTLKQVIKNHLKKPPILQHRVSNPTYKKTALSSLVDRDKIKVN